MPKIISTREHLILYLASRLPYKYLVKALYDGEVENLGSFKSDEDPEFMGWVIRIRTIIGKVDFYAFVHVVNSTHYKLHVLDQAPVWKYWVGDKCENELYRGDHPDRYFKLREQELNNG